MQRKEQGTFTKSSLVGGEAYNTFIPSPLPPVPEIDIAEVEHAYHAAQLSINALNDMVEIAADPAVLNYMYVRKEAVLSSQIEGTQSTLDDLLRFESDQVKGVPVDDVQEVSCYVAALNHGMKRMDEGFPMSLRLIREIHKILLDNPNLGGRMTANKIEHETKFHENSRGAGKTPGEFRRSQNWIGGSRPGNAHFVPAPPDKIADLMSDLEKFLYNDEVPPLFRAALIHQQFETIHPFLDGNGRVGRLLITLFLHWQGCLKSPLLYLSLFFKKNRRLYYDKLDAVRHTGDWEDWINFFFEGITETANNARKTLLAVKKIFAKTDEKISSLGRPRISASQVMNEFKRKPLLTVSEIAGRTGLSNNTVLNSIERLIELGIVKRAGDRKWGQIFIFTGYADVLDMES